jgi:tetratricopeptide (TPR) repeat protein
MQRISELVSAKNFEPNMVLFHRYLNYCHKAEMLFEAGEYDAAFSLYHSSFSEQGYLLRNQFTHYARLVELSIILGKYDYAMQVLNKIFGVYVQNNHPSNGTLGSILYATYYLAKGDYEPVFDYIDKGMSLNSLQVYYLYKIKLRILENFYFALSGDLHFASRLSSKNIRYIQMQNLSMKTYHYAHLFIIMKNLKDINRKGRLMAKMMKMLKEFEMGPDKIYGILLQRLFEKYAVVSLN